MADLESVLAILHKMGNYYSDRQLLIVATASMQLHSLLNGLFGIGLSLTAASSVADPISIQVVPPEYGTSDRLLRHGLDRWAQEANKSAPDLVRITILGASQNRSADVVDLILAEQAGAGVIASDHLASKSGQKLGILGLPFLFSNEKEVTALQQSPIGQAMLAPLEQIGLIGLGYWNFGITQIVGRKAYASASSLKGQKFFAASTPQSLSVFEGFGARTISHSIGDLNPAFQQGAVDAAEISLIGAAENFGGTNLYLTPINVRSRSFIVVIRAALWNQLPYRAQFNLASTVKENARYLEQLVEHEQRVTLENLPKRGIKLATVTTNGHATFRKVANPAWASEAKAFGGGLNVIDEFFRIRRDISTTPAIQREISATGASESEIDVYFVTDRARENESDPFFRFGGRRGQGNLSYGRARISIGSSKPVGGAVTKGSQVSLIEEGDSSWFETRVKREIGASHKHEAFVFVHGFNNSHIDAVIRAASLATDLRFPGPVIAYSWPSDGSVERYLSDESDSEWTEPHFRSFMQILAGFKDLKRLHLVAHSMGGRIAMRWIDRMGLSNVTVLNNLILAAPDIDAGIFSQQVAAAISSPEIVTLYGSANDRALMVSRTLHNYPRAGEGGDRLPVIRGIDSIDASDVDTSIIGHSYVSTSRSVVSDLYQLFANDLRPASRFGLEERKKGGVTFWYMRP